MKKLLALILATFMMISIFAACGGGDEAEGEEKAEENVDGQEKPPVDATEEEENQNEPKEVIAPDEVENAVDAFVKAAILKEVEDSKYKVFKLVGDDLKDVYKSENSPFGGNAPKSLADELLKKVNVWAEKIKDDELENGIKNKAKGFLERWLEEEYYSHKITDCTNDEETATVEVTIERYNLSKLDEALKELVEDVDIVKLIKAKNSDGLAEKVSDKIEEIANKNANEYKIITTSKLTLEKKNDKWLITNDGSLEPEPEPEPDNNKQLEISSRSNSSRGGR
ncbi:MAG: hypothetical protein IJO61_04380 [Oscillospiraceae bacterium]|nr:hypothetical protein [Oscillospiraceae bacterium]